MASKGYLSHISKASAGLGGSSTGAPRARSWHHLAQRCGMPGKPGPRFQDRAAQSDGGPTPPHAGCALLEAGAREPVGRRPWIPNPEPPCCGVQEGTRTWSAPEVKTTFADSRQLGLPRVSHKADVRPLLQQCGVHAW